MVIAALAGLALVDSTSIGTLVIPLWLLLSPDHPPRRRIVEYLLTIAIFYFAVGVVLTFVAKTGADRLRELMVTPMVLWPQLVVGIALFALSWRFDSKKRRESGTPDRAVRWRGRASTAQTSGRGLAVLALTAGTIELFSMLPYLAAIGLLVSTGYGTATSFALLAAYCAVMVAPAAVLMVARNALGGRIEPMLTKLDALLSRHADSAIGWVLGIVGFLLAANAAQALFFE